MDNVSSLFPEKKAVELFYNDLLEAVDTLCEKHSDITLVELIGIMEMVKDDIMREMISDD